MDYAEYKKLKEEIDAEYQKKKEALEMVWHMSQKHNKDNVSGANNTDVSFSDSVRKVIAGLTGDFTVNEVKQGLEDHGVKEVDRLAITNTLHRLFRRKEIEVVRKGAGRTSSVYRKVVESGEVL